MTPWVDQGTYILDPLYGVYNLPDWLWDAITTPELQRLREVRLCNINSLALMGAANVSRYEHAIGTCYLAIECLRSWPGTLDGITSQDEKRIILAALLHDVASGALGHSVEYIESREGFDHERAFSYVVTGGKEETYAYRSSTLEPIFFGMPRSLSGKLTEEDVAAIGEMVAGKGRFGQLISGTMDLDNIDNVFRLAYHMGLVKSGSAPLRLARSLAVTNGRLTVKKEATPFIQEWHNTRAVLYRFLLLNPEEFAGKCMLSEAIEESKAGGSRAFSWHDVDYELFQKLSRVSADTRTTVSRLMKGDLYGCIGIYASSNTMAYRAFIDPSRRGEMEASLSKILRAKFSSRLKSASIALHSIFDVNKTERCVDILTDEGESVRVGRSSNRLLVGVFFRNVGLNMHAIRRIPEELMTEINMEVQTYLMGTGVLSDPTLVSLELHGEAGELRGRRNGAC